MMPKPYSYDLRQRVIEAIELDGMKKSEAVQVFQVSRNTIHLWLAQLAKTGDYQAKPNEPRGNGHTAICDRTRHKYSKIKDHRLKTLRDGSIFN
jgi:transposase